MRDLRTGERLVSADASPTFREAMPEIGGYFVTDLELRRTGSVAWIVRLEANGRGLRAEVRKTDATIARESGSRRSSKLLDGGEQIAKRSLALTSSTITWANGGVRRSAPLE